MIKRINLLSEETIIKIAAGEIIENPSSIIKELVENSIDANSETINIEIGNNGKDYIKVRDDGIGFKREDLKLAFKRHTTSKISNIKDLDEALTLGFRGEALSSIANVSNVVVITKTKEDSVGTLVKINHNGDIISMEDIVTNNGTTIICKDLFDNIPVRKKYLESKNYEVNKTNDIITRLSLSHTDISFEYIKDDKLVLKTNRNAEQINNIYSVLGKNVAENLLEFSCNEESFSVKGFISNNNLYKSNRNNQFIFVNNRSITDNGISRGIEKQYNSIIPLNRYPVFLLYINIDSELIDVNIHPKKDVIKFLNIEEIINTLSMEVHNKLFKNLKIFEVQTKNKDSKNIFNKYYTNDSDNFISNSDNIIKFKDLSYENNFVNDEVNEIYTDDKREDNNSQVVTPSENVLVENDFEDIFFEKEKSERKILVNGYRHIGNLFLQYILLEDNVEKSLYILDHHAAHERINYEKLIKDYEKNNIPTQNLISGFLVELTNNEFDLVISIKDKLNSVGIEIEEFGDNSIIIRSIPAYIENIDPERLIRDIIDSSNKLEHSIYDIDPYTIMKKACSASIKTGDNVSKLDVVKLIEMLDKCNMPFTCPHGRPTLVKITKNQLDKEFFRIQNEG